MIVKYKQRCNRCKKNYVVTTRRQPYVNCYDCQKHELVGVIKDPVMKKLFDIPPEFYEQNHFLRSIKINYLKYKELSEKQVTAFKKTVERMREENKYAPV